ncbi:hypothetical protein DERF_005218 [Dermatophagoides farinae]|uniref:Uncharacterized protein n=1 Tax=Dermatophagoides farinae TaxID=6954 RepID=A0A922L6C9_DERFA|nr:hypothetical protein DERF_005218 [Dermatophagoides farinae]
MTFSYFLFFHCIAFHSSMSFQFDCQYIGIYGSSNKTKRKNPETLTFELTHSDSVQSINF